ncbi:MAG: PIN domain-containing protein [Vicinamibacterales bacterium]
MIVVDTSVWLEAPRQRAIADALRQLIESDEAALALPVRLELLEGMARSDRAAFRRVFAALPQLHPTGETWTPIPGWIEKANDAGECFGLVDLLIAAMAAEIGGLVWSLDKNFERMEKLEMVSLYALPH